MAHLPHDMNYWAPGDANKLAGTTDNLTAIPSNGTTFNMGQPIEVTIPMGSPQDEVNFSTASVSFDITNNNATNAVVLQSRVGTMGLVDVQHIKPTAGTTPFSNFDAYNVLTPVLIQKQVSPNWYDYNGNLAFGCSSDDAGAGDSIAVGATVHKTLPIINSGIAVPHFPMDSTAGIVFQFKLDGVAVAFSSDATADAVQNSEIVISNIVFHYDVTHKTDQAQALIDKSLVNKTYVMDVLDWKHQQLSVAANLTKFSVRIGVSAMRAKRLIMVLRSTDRLAVPLNKGLIGRNKAGITKVQCKWGNKSYKNSGLELTTTNPVDAYVSLMKQKGGVFNSNPSSLKYDEFNLLGAGTAPAASDTIGSYFYEIDFTNGYDSLTAKSGISIGFNSLEVFVDKTATEAQTVDFFVEYWNQYSMHQDEKVWKISDAMYAPNVPN